MNPDPNPNPNRNNPNNLLDTIILLDTTFESGAHLCEKYIFSCLPKEHSSLRFPFPFFKSNST